MNPAKRSIAGVAGMLLAGAALASGPINPPPSSCAIDEVYKCMKIGNQTFCRCVKRDVAIPGGVAFEPQAAAPGQAGRRGDR